MFLHIDCNTFYASCEVSLRPDLKGKPVVVANCNEAGGGIILALTKEAKALGLKRGNPVFQVSDVLKKHNVVMFRANLPKYVDISKRLMQVMKDQEIVLNFKQYSVDEFFGELPLSEPAALREYALKVKNHIERCMSIPVSCGVSATYTLAKVATWYAKHYPAYEGVCVLPADKYEVALRGLPIEDVWGVGRRTVPQMHSLNIHTAWDLTQRSAVEIEHRFRVTGLRTWQELQGTPCISIDNPALQKSIAHTRTFARMTADKERLHSYVSDFAVSAARKLRDQHGVCSEVSTFVATNPHRSDLAQYSDTATVRLPVATADTRLIARAALEALDKIFRENYMYKRAGVILSDIATDACVQLDLFAQSAEQHEKSKALMSALDHLTTRYGMDSVRLASQDAPQAPPNGESFVKGGIAFDVFPAEGDGGMGRQDSLSLGGGGLSFQPLRNETTDINDIIEVK